MSKTKKETLPEGIEELLESKSMDELKEIFETCDLDATGGYSKQACLSFSTCPDDLARWLVNEGADIDFPDSYKKTPLHERSGSWRQNIDILLALGANIEALDSNDETPLHKAASSYKPEAVKTLLTHGAEVDPLNSSGHSPLAKALCQCSNIHIIPILEIVSLLLDAGAEKTEDMKSFVVKIGETLEFHKAHFEEDTFSAMAKLNSIFDVKSAPERKIHDGHSQVVASGDNFQTQYKKLWDYLVPSSGAAETVQGELIRISGRIRDEWERNGGANWDKQYELMAKSYLKFISLGNKLEKKQVKIIKPILAKPTCDSDRLRELQYSALMWIQLNPDPIRLPMVKYSR